MELIKMTLLDVIQLVADEVGCDRNKAVDIVLSLQALGLIKFEEVKKPSHRGQEYEEDNLVVVKGQLFPYNIYVEYKQVIEELQAWGYKIVKE